MSDLAADVLATIRDVPDFPEPGILFKDITPVLADPALYPRVLDWMAAEFADAKIDRIVGIEARGFLFGPGLVERLGAGFVPLRKPGKLPHATVGRDYTLEYGQARIEMHKDAIKPGDRVLIVDDLLATGGTMRAAIDIVRECGGEVVGCAFLIELGFLHGNDSIDAPIHSLVRY